MATSTHNATAVDAANNAWPLLMGGTKVTAVASPDDDAGTFIQSTADGQAQLFSFNFAGIPTGAPIVSVVVNVRAQRDSGGNKDGGVGVRIFDGSNTQTSSTITTTSAWVTSTRTLATQADGVTPWTRAALSTHTFGVVDAGGSNGRSQVTTITVSVTFIPRTGRVCRVDRVRRTFRAG